MDTIGRMLNEYASMYAGGDGEELDKARLMEMFQAEAKKGDGAQAAAAGEAPDGASDSTEASVDADEALDETVVMDRDGLATLQEPKAEEVAEDEPLMDLDQELEKKS